MGQIKDLIKQAHDNAVRHGFYEKEPSFGDLISLIHFLKQSHFVTMLEIQSF